MKFEDLDAWKNARFLVKNIYSLTKLEPLSRDFRLSSQIQGAAVSVMSNVAEGFERIHIAEKVQFYNMARSSCGEVRSLLFVISDNYSQHDSTISDTIQLTESVGKLITGLISCTQRRR